MSIFGKKETNVMKEIQDTEERIKSAQSLMGVLESQLANLKKERLREIATRKCPACGAEVRLSHLGYAGAGSVNNSIDCVACGRRFSANARRTGPNELLDASYEISELSHVGWIAEDKPVKELSDDEVAILIEFLSGMPSDALTQTRRNLLSKLMDEKLLRLQPGTKE
jgi:hypothetical protein